MAAPRVLSMSFANVWDALVAKAERKGRTRSEVMAVTTWLTGYSEDQINELLIKEELSYADFFHQAPRMNPMRNLVTGSICGVRVQDIDDPLMHDIRVLDKMVDELARGKALEKVLRSHA